MSEDNRARGYWRRYRSMMDHPLHPLQQKRAFTEFEAMQDMIDNATGKRYGRERIIRGQVVNEPRGSWFVSVRFLQERWRWGSYGKVRRFVLLMQQIGFLKWRRIESVGGSLIEVANYDYYNPLPSEAESATDQQANHRWITGGSNINKGIQEMHKEVVESWNAFASRSGLAQVQKLTRKRKSAISARLKDSDFDLDDIFAKIEASDFLRGNNNRGWRADFDFVFGSPNNYVKILEGKYDNREAAAEGPEYEEEP